MLWLGVLSTALWGWTALRGLPILPGRMASGANPYVISAAVVTSVAALVLATLRAWARR
jgi:hypothetical protein